MSSEMISNPSTAHINVPIQNNAQAGGGASFFGRSQQQQPPQQLPQQTGYSIGMMPVSGVQQGKEKFRFGLRLGLMVMLRLGLRFTISNSNICINQIVLIYFFQA